MNLRTLILLLIMVAIAALAVLNWPLLATPTTMSLGLTTVQAPLGLIMLALTALMAAMFLAYVLGLHGSVLLEARRHAKEMTAQRELADKAEASRFTELRSFLDVQHSAMLARMDALEARMSNRLKESDNSTAAYVGQLEDQLQRQGGSGSGGVQELRIEPGLRP
ncbi:Signal transduction histidine kinase [Melaminivora suipulveris]|uniref:Signal transduction histidine kinase n=1 Tax=Melaminivora suipulveris TaxID=2109913 RepID=A0A2R3QEP8_9BURK|nr:Signal transduction histidine kinase [Melaminivora suipulveris]AVO50253.1 Signal transduction histidine kinase [Melaminivora suipulveris]